MRTISIVALVLWAVTCGGCGHSQSGGGRSAANKSDEKQVTELSLDLLAKTADDELSQTVVHYVFYKIGDGDHESEIVAGLPSSVRAVYLIRHADGEINNGGYSQYFVNSEGKWAGETVKAYELVGSNEAAALMKQAIGIFLSEMTPDELKKAKSDVRAFANYAKTSDLSALDSKYYELDTPSIACDKYIRAHPDEFVAK